MIDEKKLIEELSKNSIFEKITVGEETVYDIIARLPKVGEWIPVAELDLDHEQEALIKLDDGFVCRARFLIGDYSNYCCFYNKYIGFLRCTQVVEWMPYREKVE